jgi:hypothetical protein
MFCLRLKILSTILLSGFTIFYLGLNSSSATSISPPSHPKYFTKIVVTRIPKLSGLKVEVENIANEDNSLKISNESEKDLIVICKYDEYLINREGLFTFIHVSDNKKELVPVNYENGVRSRFYVMTGREIGLCSRDVYDRFYFHPERGINIPWEIIFNSDGASYNLKGHYYYVNNPEAVNTYSNKNVWSNRIDSYILNILGILGVLVILLRIFKKILLVRYLVILLILFFVYILFRIIFGLHIPASIVLFIDPASYKDASILFFYRQINVNL